MRILTLEQYLAERPQWGGTLRADGRVDVYESAEERPVVATVYPTLTPRQVRLALHGAGLLVAVEAAIATAGPEAQIVWEYAIEFERHHPLVATLAPAIGMTEEQLDALWMAAAEL